MPDSKLSPTSIESQLPCWSGDLSNSGEFKSQTASGIAI